MTQGTGAMTGRYRPAAVIGIACVGAAVATTGIQGITPAIPAIQEQFALSTAQVGLITSGYLLPSIFSAFLAGMLADRIGLRPVFAASLLVFGLPVPVLFLWQSFEALMAVRFVQGAAFGAVMALSVSIIGGVAPTGAAAARGQSRRIITMTVAEAVFPIAGGLLLVLGWLAPFAVQIVAIPAAVAAWVLLPPLRRASGGTAKARTRDVFDAPSIVGVQVLGALRFIFKFSVLTYYPLVAADAGLSGIAIGFVMGASGLIAAVTAAFTERLARRWSSAKQIGGSLGVAALSVAVMAVAVDPMLAVVAIVLFGLQDGVYGVAHNVLVTELSPPGARSAYVGVTGTVRNVGKFIAPLSFGAVTLVLTVSQAFLVLVGVGAVSLLVARSVDDTLSRIPAEPDA
ncbi:MAG: transporter, family, multidrug resistance protein [Pseudonocardiales bacterium]|nr:transporter, family, multidrug resistance protein [Pseudonocardiales bacterium]